MREIARELLTMLLTIPLQRAAQSGSNKDRKGVGGFELQL